MKMGEAVLVTGAEGFIGSHLCESLIESGRKVKAFVQYNSFNSIGWLETIPLAMRKEIEITFGDLRDIETIRMSLKNCNSVLHLGALIAIPYSYRAPISYVETNVMGTLNLLLAARDQGNLRVIHTSTSEVYGSAQFIPMTEDHPINTQSPYAASKAAADNLAMSFFHTFETPITILRPFNCFGPRQSARAIIPAVITQLIKNGGTVHLGNIYPTREFNFVRDTCNAFVRTLDSANSIGEIINIGNSFEISIEDLCILIGELINIEPLIVTDTERVRPKEGEVDRLCSDSSKARKLLGWSPKSNGLEGLKVGLTETIEWFSDPENLDKYASNNYVV